MPKRLDILLKIFTITFVINNSTLASSSEAEPVTVNHLVVGSIPTSPANSMNNFKETDNFFPIILQKEIMKKYIYGNNKWIYTANATYKDDEIGTYMSTQWAKNYSYKDTEIFALTLDPNEKINEKLVNNIKFFTAKKFNEKINEIFRLQFIYTPPDPKYPKNTSCFPHVDSYEPHKTILYYLVDSDAETIFFDQTFKSKSEIDFSNNKILYKVRPKQGKAVLFDGLNFHAGSVSRLSKRILLNINFI